MEWDEKRKLKIALKIELIILFILLSTIYIDINGGWLFVQNLIPDFNTHYTILDISKLRWADLNEFKGKYVQIEGYYMGQSVPVDKNTLQELLRKFSGFSKITVSKLGASTEQMRRFSSLREVNFNFFLGGNNYQHLQPIINHEAGIRFEHILQDHRRLSILEESREV